MKRVYFACAVAILIAVAGCGSTAGTSGAPDPATLHAPWLASITPVLEDATLAVPTGTYMHGARGRGGRQGVHTEHLGHLLTEMQFLQRAYPGAQW